MPVAAWAAIPPVPSGGDFLNDYAEIIDADTERRIGEFQERAFEDHGTPIVVVTVFSMAEYGFPNATIEEFAMEWFNAWGIGSEDQNTGVLLLVSVDDRKARIELGADWGRKWDDHCKSIMDGEIIPRFKAGDYPAGILDGAEALYEMATLGPEGTIPAAPLMQRLKEGPPLSPMSPIPALSAYLLIGIAVICIIAAIFVPGLRKTLLIIAAICIGVSLFLWVILIIFGIYARLFGGGGYSSGGGFGGGFSGGGGASGGW
jgi:uncharacterized protein